MVATVMSNLGLERYLQSIDLKLERTAVGDRYVLERMHSDGYNVGGEQSGHMIFSDYAKTGDCLLAALQVLAVLIRAGRPMSEVARVFAPLPQVLKNARYGGGDPLQTAAVKAAIADGERALNGTGRLLIRKSGTEPVIRVMAEGENQRAVAGIVDAIVGAIEAEAKEGSA